MMIIIGAVSAKGTKNNEDYFLGGRNLGGWTAALSAQASDMSGWLLLGLPGAAFLTGLSGSIWMAGGLALGTYLNWRIIAKKLRIDTQKVSYPRLLQFQITCYSIKRHYVYNILFHRTKYPLKHIIKMHTNIRCYSP